MVSRGPVIRLGAGIVGSGAGLALVLSLVIAASAQASSTYYVSPSGSGTTCSVSSPCSLASAIGFTEPGDTVVLAGGTYTLSLGDGIVLSDDITLMGTPGAGAILNGSDLSNQQILRANDGVTVEDLTFEDSILGVWGAGGLTTITDSTFVNNNNGVEVSNGAEADITDTTITGSGTSDIENGGTTTVTSSTLINSGTGSGYVFYEGGTINAGADIMVAGSGLQVCSNPGTLTDLGYNIATDNTCNFDGTGSVSDSSTIAGSLGTLSGSGETQVIPLEAGSPALRLVTGTLSGGTAVCGTADQLGSVRPTGSCDAGAYEVSTGNTAPATTGTTTTSTTPTTPTKPSISAAVSSAHARTSYGWYGAPVTVTFTCDANGATLTAACPAAVTLGTGAAQTVSRTITTTAGASASTTVSGINVDTTKPELSVKGVKSGHVYFGKAPKLRCVAQDAISGVASCTIKLHVKHASAGTKLTQYTALATSKAGNSTVVQGSYKLKRRR